MRAKKESIHWADVIATNVLERGKKHVIATGITPSGHIHIGNMREVVTADAVDRALKNKGADTRVIYIADTYDPLRKAYPFLPDDYALHVGKPISEIPDPEGCCSNYAEHFLCPFLEALEKLGITMEVYRADQMYKRGEYTEVIKVALKNRDKIAQILDDITGKTTPTTWSPFNPLCKECGRITMATVTGQEGDQINYRCQCGSAGTADISKGEGKLTWRVDWPARWKMLGITVEPFGKDHAVAGGSYDTGVRISKEVYNYEPPYPIAFEHIFLKGKGKMSSSMGVTISIQDMLDVVPPEVLHYMIIRTKPERHIDFDPGLALLNLIDEYDGMTQDNRPYKLSQLPTSVSTRVPFRHVVTIVQIAKDFNHVIEVLKRSGYEIDDINAIRQRVHNARNWLDKFAPPSVKFKIQESTPPAIKDLSSKQKKMLAALATQIERRWTADALHEEIYRIAKEVGVEPKEAFRAIYIALLGTSSGPRAGWFLISLDPAFVRERLEQISQV